MSALSGSSNKVISKLIPLKSDSKTNNNELVKYDFIVGDRVYIASNPDRMGTAVFNGTTKFSDGIWIGVALDQPYGKNNGVVQGVTYFQCEENHGIFVRPNNLRHASHKDLSITNYIDQRKSSYDQMNNSNLPIDPDQLQSPDHGSIVNNATKLNLGDRVYVAGKYNGSGHKNGILRFLGHTQFSDGCWAGIELDNPMGKNDGSVNGIRYFSCKNQYGLFALEDKVKKIDLSFTKGFDRRDSSAKNGSTESVSSVASNFSSASRTRARQGMNAISTQKKYKGERSTENTTDRSKYLKINSRDVKTGDKSTSAIQNVLKEKEQHVEQLLREREIERIDLATATAKIEELEKYHSRHLNSFTDPTRINHDKQFNELQNTVYLLSQERDRLLERLEEEKKKVDDLQFRIEEKDIDESDLENKTEENESHIFELNEKLALERELREQLEKRLSNVASSNDSNGTDTKYINQIRTLEGKIMKLKLELNEERNDSKVKSLSKLLEEKEAVVNDMQDRFEKVKFRFMDCKKELDTLKKLQSVTHSENTSLRNEIASLQSSLADVMKSQSSGAIPFSDKSDDNNHNEENRSKELMDLEILRAENKTLNDALVSLNQEMEVHHRDSEERRLEINDVQQKCKQLEQEKLDQIKAKRSLVEDNDKLVAQLSSYNKQLEKLRSQISDLHNDNKRLIESKYEFENNEKNLKLELENLRGQITFLETENSSLVKSLHEFESDSSQNSCILQLSVKIEQMETSIQELSAQLKSEKVQNSALITKNATLYSDLEHLKQKKDDDENIIYDQLESLKSINKFLESDKVALLESAEAKTKELIVIRDRLLKVSQEHESLQDNFNKVSQKYEQDKRILMDKLRKVEKHLDDSERKSQFSLSESTSDKRKTDSKDQLSQLKDAKENAEQQISFLNNVIVHSETKFKALQAENDLMRERIQALESGSSTLPSTKKQVTPRLYCDVCEVFDSHDTDKCPLPDNQSCSSSSPPKPNTPIGTKVKGKSAPRLYCDICEMFDSHDTLDCQDQQTF